MQQQATLGMTDYWQIAVRRKWLIVACVVVSILGAAILCYVLPKSFRSSTLILVEDQKVPEDYVKATVIGSVEERLTMIEQQVLSRTLLTSIVEEFKLYKDDIRRAGIEAVIEALRRNIKVETVGGTGPVRGVEAFSVSFSHENPTLAMGVTARLASLFIEENLKVREQLATGTSEFLEQELQLAKGRLEEKEQGIREYKSKHMGILPQQMEANLRALDRLQNDLISVTEMYNSVGGRLGMIEKAIKEYEATGKKTDDAVGGPGNENSIDHLHARLKELERSLVVLTSEYKDTYPDVIQAKKEIDKLKIQLAARYREMEEESQAKPKKESSLEVDLDSKRIFDPYLRELVRQRSEIKIELAGLDERRHRLSAQMREYESRVEKTPALEQELTLLMRDYDNMQSNYQRLLEKRLNARVAENLEKRQKGEQFRIIDPANFPEKPEKPNQVRIMLMGLAVGCALGFGGAFSFELLQPVFRRSEDVEGLLGLPILATIPLFESVLGKPYKLIPSVNFRPFLGRAERLLSSATPENGGEPSGLKEIESARSEDKQLRPSLAGHQVVKSAMQLPPDVNLICKWRPWSVVAEQFRVAATRLTLMQANRASTVVIVTSSVKGEGKSCVTVNLGYVLARDLGKSTLIVDCDLKCPVVYKYAGLKRDPGLRDILNGKESVDNCIQSCGDVPLWAIAAGSSPTSTTELSKVHQLNKILSELRNRFDYILLDAPPILPLADMHVLAGMADVVAMVIRSGATSQAIVKKGLNTLRPTKETCIILNGLQSEMVPYYMQEGYDYFIQKKELPRV